MLTKNPLLPVKLGYLDLFQSWGRISPDHPKQAQLTPPFQVQVSLAFWRDEARRAYDVAAPSVEDRKAGVRALRDAGWWLAGMPLPTLGERQVEISP